MSLSWLLTFGEVLIAISYCCIAAEHKNKTLGKSPRPAVGQGVYHGQPAPVLSQCSILLHIFAETSSNFTGCVITNAMPEQMCFSCIQEYLNLQSSYDDVTSDNWKIQDPTTDDTMTCYELFSTAEVQYLTLTYQSLTNLWMQSRCNACYVMDTTKDQPTSQWTNLTLTLYNLYQNYTKCLNTYGYTNYVPVIVNESSSNLSIICEKCASYFFALSDSYQDAVNHNQDFCTDIKAKVNETLNAWSWLHCSATIAVKFTSGTIGTICICFFVLLMTVVFYVGNYVQAERKTRRLRKYKHKRSQGPRNDTWLLVLDRRMHEPTTRQEPYGELQSEEVEEDEVTRRERVRSATLG